MVEAIKKMEFRDKEDKLSRKAEEHNYMNILFLNIIGCCSRIKRKRITFVIQSDMVNLCFVQEFKLKVFNSSFQAEFWGNKEVELTHYDYVGASGWMIILWRKNLSSLNHSFRGEGFVGVNTYWKGISYNFINIYASCNLVSRRLMWLELLKVKNNSSCVEWCLGGDFYAVINKEKRLRA